MLLQPISLLLLASLAMDQLPCAETYVIKHSPRTHWPPDHQLVAPQRILWRPLNQCVGTAGARQPSTHAKLETITLLVKTKNLLARVKLEPQPARLWSAPQVMRSQCTAIKESTDQVTECKQAILCPIIPSTLTINFSVSKII